MSSRFGYKLFAPEEFWNSDWQKYFKKCNGCGTDSTEDIRKRFFNLDYILDVCVRPACSIHDYMYLNPKKPSHEDRMACDRVFHNNLVRICKAEGKKKNSWRITKWLRNKACFAYYLAVKNFGGSAYWENHNEYKKYRNV